MELPRHQGWSRRRTYFFRFLVLLIASPLILYGLFVALVGEGLTGDASYGWIGYGASAVGIFLLVVAFRKTK